MYTTTNFRAKEAAISIDPDSDDLLDPARAVALKSGFVRYKARFARKVAAVAAIFVGFCVVVALMTGWAPTSSPVEDWKSQLAARYDVQSFDRWEQQPAFALHVRWLGRDVDVEALGPDIRYDTAAVREIDGDIALHFLFRTPIDDPISVFMRQTQKPTLSKPVVELRHGFQTATWTKEGVEVFVISDAGFDNVWDVARFLSAQ